MSVPPMLPRDVIGIIIQLLPKTHAFRCRRVCKCWYQAGRVLLPPLAASPQIELISHSIPAALLEETRKSSSSFDATASLLEPREHLLLVFDLRTERFIFVCSSHSSTTAKLFSRDGQLLGSAVLEETRFVRLRNFSVKGGQLCMNDSWGQAVVLGGFRAQPPLMLQFYTDSADSVRVAFGLTEGELTIRTISNLVIHDFHVYKNRIAALQFGEQDHRRIVVYERNLAERNESSENRFRCIFMSPFFKNMYFDCAEQQVVSFYYGASNRDIFHLYLFLDLETVQLTKIRSRIPRNRFRYTFLSVEDGFHYTVQLTYPEDQLEYIAVDVGTGRVVRHWKRMHAETNQESRKTQETLLKKLKMQMEEVMSDNDLLGASVYQREVVLWKGKKPI